MSDPVLELRDDADPEALLKALSISIDTAIDLIKTTSNPIFNDNSRRAIYRQISDVITEKILDQCYAIQDSVSNKLAEMAPHKPVVIKAEDIGDYADDYIPEEHNPINRQTNGSQHGTSQPFTPENRSVSNVRQPVNARR